VKSVTVTSHCAKPMICVLQVRSAKTFQKAVTVTFPAIKINPKIWRALKNSYMVHVRLTKARQRPQGRGAIVRHTTPGEPELSVSE